MILKVKKENQGYQHPEANKIKNTLDDKENIIILVPASIKQELQMKCIKNKTTMTAVINKFITDYVNE